MGRCWGMDCMAVPVDMVHICTGSGLIQVPKAYRVAVMQLLLSLQVGILYYSPHHMVYTSTKSYKAYRAYKVYIRSLLHYIRSLLHYIRQVLSSVEHQFRPVEGYILDCLHR